MKFNPLEEENMKAVLAAEKKTDDIEKRLTENVEELQGVEKVNILLVYFFKRWLQCGIWIIIG